MRKILEVKIREDGRLVFGSEYNPVKGINLYQRAFVSLMFEHDISLVRRSLLAIRLLSIAEICSLPRPQLALSMFENTVDELSQSSEEFRKRFGANLNFQPAP